MTPKTTNPALETLGLNTNDRYAYTMPNGAQEEVGLHDEAPRVKATRISDGVEVWLLPGCLERLGAPPARRVCTHCNGTGEFRGRTTGGPACPKCNGWGEEKRGGDPYRTAETPPKSSDVAPVPLDYTGINTLLNEYPVGTADYCKIVTLATSLLPGLVAREPAEDRDANSHASDTSRALRAAMTFLAYTRQLASIPTFLRDQR
jgi:hypothetical protein